MSPLNKGIIVVISGPSGVGKTTVARKVVEALEGISFSVSHTTRKPRGNEVNGRDYYFITKEEFRKMIEKNKFVEWAEVFGNLYGTSREELEGRLKEGDVVLDIDVQGALSIEREYPQSLRIILFPPSLKVLSQRIKKRGDTPEHELARRIEKARWELEHFPHFTHIVLNDDLEETVETVCCIIKAERHRRERMENKARRILWEE